MKNKEFKNISDTVLKEIQQLHEMDYSMTEISSKFGLTKSQIKRLHVMGKVNFHKKFHLENGKWKMDRSHSERTKEKLSKKRYDWMKNNPDKAGYILCHKSRGESYPEKYFREWLEKEKISFQKEYQFGYYSFDFLVNEKIDLEIDGEQHHNDKKMKEHDKRRDEASTKAGFVVYRIDWRYYQRLKLEEKEKFLNELKLFLNDVDDIPIPSFVRRKRTRLTRHISKKNDVHINYIPYMILELLEGGLSLKEASSYMGLQPNVSTLYLKSIGINHRDIKKKRNLILPNKGMDININIRDTSKEKFDKKQQAIELLKEGYSYVAVGKKFNVSDNAIRKWVKSMNIDPKSFQFYKNKNRKFS